MKARNRKNLKGINSGSRRGLSQNRIPNSPIQHIQIADGVFATVDDDGFDELSKYCWYLDDNGRATRVEHVYLGFKKYKSRHVRMHHDVIGRPPEGLVIDHINNNRLDNRLCNLQFATQKQNSQKTIKQCRKTSSKYKGVCWDKERKKWMAYLKTGGRRVFTKRFDTELEAARAYNAKAREVFGEFALLNDV
jgi:hypothetical protein